jgi:hypothetical protein
MPAMRLQQVWQNTSLTIPQSFPDLKWFPVLIIWAKLVIAVSWV